MNVSPAARQAVFVSVVALSICPALGCRKQAAPKVPEDAVAMVGNRPITRAQLQRHIDRLPPVLRQQYASAEARRPLLDALVRNELLLQEARRRGLENDPEYREIVDQQLIALLLRRSGEGQDSTQAIRDDEIERYYREHLAQFSAPEQVRISQIVVPDKALATRLLKQVRALRRNDAAGFAAIATKHSIDAPSREKGGDAGYLSRDSGAFSPTVRAAAFLLREPGDVADLVETEHGVHILRLNDRRAAAARPFEQVKDEIRQRLLYQRREKNTEELLSQSRSRHKVEVFKDRVGAPATTQPVASTKPESTPHRQDR
jgi:peptidyl-prolyl cis-trans isomerase C